MVQLSHPHMTTGKTIALTIWTFVGKVMSLLFNTLSRFVIGEGNGTPLQYSCLENPIDGGAWWAAVHGVTTSRIQLSDFTFFLYFFWTSKSLWMVDCSHEIKKCLFLGRKSMTNLDSVLKSRGIILPTKVSLVKAMVFPVVIIDVRAGP